MKAIEIQWNPSERMLRQFGVICLVALPGLALISRASWTWIAIWGVVGAVLAGIGFVTPKALKLVYVGLSVAAFPIGLVVSQVILAVIFFGVFMPVAIVFRLIGRDALERSFDQQAPSYWRPKRQPGDVQRYFRQS